MRVATTVLTMAVTFFLTPFVVRTLGERWYGVWVVTCSITFSYDLLDFGFSAAFNRFITAEMARHDPGRVNEVVSTAVALLSGVGVVVLLVTGAIWLAVPWFAGPEFVWAVRMVVLLQGTNFAIAFPSRAFAFVAISQLRYDAIEVLNIVRTLSQAVLTVLILERGGGIVGLALLAFVFGRGYQAALYGIAKKLWPALHVRVRHVRRRLAQDMFAYSWWSFVNQMADMLRFRIDAVVVAAFCGVGVVTHYSIGASLAEYSLGLVNRASNIMTPLFVRYEAEGNHEAIRSKLLLFTKLNAVLCVFGMGLTYVVGRLFIVRWMGPRFADSYVVFLVMGMALMVQAVMLMANNVLYALARHRPYAIASVCEAAANVVLSILLARRYGMVGVALGTAIPLLANQLFFTPFYTCRVVGLEVRRFYGPLVRAAVVTGGFLWVVWMGVVHYGVSPTYPAILAVSGIVTIAYLPLALYVILGAEERALVVNLLSGLWPFGSRADAGSIGR
jgi:O-antigen/teichoic acid export membrane protein